MMAKGGVYELIVVDRVISGLAGILVQSSLSMPHQSAYIQIEPRGQEVTGETMMQAQGGAVVLGATEHGD